MSALTEVIIESTSRALVPHHQLRKLKWETPIFRMEKENSSHTRIRTTRSEHSCSIQLPQEENDGVKIFKMLLL